MIRMGNTVFFIAAVVSCFHLASAVRSCDDYKRHLRNSSSVDIRSRQFMNCWGKGVEHGESDLVILMDSSGSMGQDGWNRAKDFVDALLTEIKISFDASRVAIGYFTKSHKIEINYILNPTFLNTKCRFVKDFKKIKFQDGSRTNLRGSLLDANDIFLKLVGHPTKHHLRQRTNKALIVITDGMANTKPNGETEWFTDVTPEVNKIRSIVIGQKLQVEMYAVAVTDESDVNTMKNKIATDESMFLYKPTFKDLTDLAKSIRGDAYEKDYETRNVLDNDCEEGCDAQANCGCNIRSGKNKCRCRRGYYGTAENSTKGPTCHKCKVDTYGTKGGLVTGCTKCPANSGTRGKTGCLEIADCHCNIGYEWDPSVIRTCRKVRCSSPTTVINGFITNQKECKKQEYGTKCIYRCNGNYKMIGNDTVTCGPNGTYTGVSPECRGLRCPVSAAFNDTAKYKVNCNSGEDTATKTYSIHTTCTFSCRDKYYQHDGSKRRTCLHSEKWSGKFIDCRELSCPKIVKNHAGLYVKDDTGTKDDTFDCFKTQMKVGSKCVFQCPKGFHVTGSKQVDCKKDANEKKKIGIWFNSRGFVAPNCSDYERPKFVNSSKECYDGIPLSNNTIKDRNFGYINFGVLNITDNSGWFKLVSNPPGYELGRSYPFNITKRSDFTKIEFIATDAAGNSEKCSFKISIKDNQPPTLLKCPKSPIKVKAATTRVRVPCETPTYKDNCGTYGKSCRIDIYSPTPCGGYFTKGVEQNVVYTATDPSGNKNERCTFRVEVEALGCPVLPVPKNGMMVMVRNDFGFPSCPQSHRAGKPGFPTYYMCVGGNWMKIGAVSPVPLPGEKLVPDCVAQEPATGVKENVTIKYQYPANCTSKAVQEEIKEKLKKDPVLCGFNGMLCNATSFDIYCGQTDAVKRRRRRSVQQLTVRITIKLTRTKQEAMQDLQGVQFKRKMQNDVIPKVIQRVNSASGLDRIDRNIKGVDSVQASSNPVLACAKKGDVYDQNAKNEGKCYVCPSGEFKNLATGFCQKCPPGTYQPNEGSFSCIKCPKGSTSIGKDVSNVTSCRSYCEPGEFSETGLSPCIVAAPGYYAEGHGSKLAKTCPSGTTTVITGTKSRYDCGTKCQPGTYSETGVEPCKPCGQGSYQQEQGQLNCIECPGLTWTYGEGADHASKCVDINACSSNPCLSGGHCVDLKVGFRCECKQGYWGSRCEKEVDECALKPCLNGGKCLDKFQGYLCICPDGVRGKNCEQLYGICKTGVCGSHGECVDLADNSHKCVCNDDYTGPFCETFIDSCQSEPCQNGGICESRASAYTCRCKPGFTGKQCETKLNFCASEPCKNGGECSDSKYGFICKCTAPYFGVQCEQKTNMCHHTICQHSVGCKDLGTDVKCSCKPGYGGKYCDRKFTSDFDIGFQNREAPTFSSVEGKFDLSQFTVAFWMRTSDKENKGTPLSYANKRNGKVDDNALVIADYTSFDLTINNVTANLDFSTNDGEWHHVAITWSNSNGQWIAYKDGTELMRSSAPFQQGQIVSKGGIFIIGEEQDEIGGSFTPTESFFGDMSQLNVWKSVLSPNHIYDLATSCKHASGDVLAWADFSEQSHGSVVKTEPSIACDFRNELREFQSLRGWQLPVSLRSVISTETHSDAKSCAKRCLERRVMDNRCRSFIHDTNAKKCTFYKKSAIIELDERPVKATQLDLYQFSCVTPLGLSNSLIPDSKITASSSMSGSAPSMARLYNTQTSRSRTFAHWSPSSSDTSPFLEIDLGEMYKITGIATQGHFESSVNEFAGFYTVKYKFMLMFPWLTFSHPTSGSRFTANTNSHGVVRNELLLYALKLRIYPEKGPVSSRIAMRVEIYGCPERPQGQPVSKPDNSDCVGSSCLNGGTCVDLYKRYACVCPQGFIGSRCQTVAHCPDPDIPVHGHEVSANTGVSGMKTSVVVGCLPGYTTNDNTRKSCVKGRWIGSNVVCKPKDECATKPCFGNHCQELQGGYRCYCPAGYNLAADGKTCQDIDECLIGNGGCNHKCANTPGSFICTCNRGYRLEGKLLCIDNDECQGSSHGCEQDCVNTLGSFKCLCKSGYTLNSDGKTCGQTACPYIPNIANGQITRSRLKVAYSCSTGYQLNGPAIRHCLPDGNWSGEQPTCKRVNCGKLGGETAIISIPSTTYDSIARFSCPTSYSLIGTSTRKCLKSGQWSDSHPRCAKSACPRLSNPINGQILGLGTVVGSVARVKCNKGYRLVQTNLELRTCQSNGQWTRGNTAVVTCKIIDCGTPTKNSYVQISLRGGTTYQSSAAYTCSQSNGQRCLEGSATRHCNADGKWSGKEPSCVANSCCKPKIPEHSTFYSDNSYFYGDKVYTKCDTGYVTGGTALRTCQNNGQYSGAQTTCTIVDCGDPGSVSNGVRMMSATTYQSTAKYFCHPGYKLLGSPERVCQAEGQWSGQATSCVKSSCGGRKLGSSGTITTAGGKEVCHWLIQVGQGKKVNIDFTSFNIGDKDMVKIYDGQKYEEYITFTKKQQPRSFTGNSHFMRVIYIGEDTSGSGFSLNFKGATCGGHLDAEYGVITSPGYPISYNPNDECFWTVHRPYQKIQMSFTDFFLQKSDSDTVEMFEGPFQKARMLLHKSYGYGAPALPWADRWIWVHFKVDWVHQDMGFKAVYSIYEPTLV